MNRREKNKRAARIAQGTVRCRSRCPMCNYGPLDGVTHVDLGSHEEIAGLMGKPVRPKPGDLTVCGNCGTLLGFADEHLSLKKASEEQEAEARADERFAILRQTTRRCIALDGMNKVDIPILSKMPKPVNPDDESGV